MRRQKSMFGERKSGLVGILGLSLLLMTSGMVGAQDVEAPATAAIVNGTPITREMIGAVVAQDGQTLEDVSQDVQQKLLKRLITQRLFVDEALRAELDQKPAVVAAIAHATNQILAEAYIEKQAAQLEPPTTEEVLTYFDEHPELFAQRKIYRMQELAAVVPKEQQEAALAHYHQIDILQDMVKWYEQQGLAYGMNVVERPAEDWPTDLLPLMVQLEVGQTLKIEQEAGISILQLLHVEDVPLTFEEAAPFIEKFLLNQKKQALIRNLTEKLRQDAEIEYLPPFSEE